MKKHARYWTPEQEAVLRERYPHERTEDIAAAFGWDVKRIYVKAKLMGLKKTPEFLSSVRSGRMQPGSQLGAATRFQAGQPSWNKGRSYQPGGRVWHSQFKKGSTPHNSLPVGTVLMATIGFLKRKVAEPNKWVWVHRDAWEQAHGPVPKGHVIAFKDGNRENCAVENLELVSRAEWMRRNSYLRFPEELRELVHMRAVLTREINKQTKKS